MNACTAAVIARPGPEAQRTTAPAPTRRDTAEPHMRRAEQLRLDGSFAAAAEAYEAALEADPTNPGALVGLAELLLRRGDAGRAQLLLLRCCGVAPGLALAWSLLGLALRASGDAAAAETAFAEAQRLEPAEYGHAIQRMLAAQEAGRAELELARLEQEAAANPLDAVLLTARGALLERVGRNADAIDVLETAVLLAPEASVPALELAHALMRSPRGEAAAAALSRAIDLLPDEPMLRSNRAVVLMRLHRHREAVTEIRALIAEDGATPEMLCNLSTALTALGEQDAAVEAARSAAERAPSLHLPWRSLVSAMAYQSGVTGAAMLAAGRRAAMTLPRQTGRDDTARDQAEPGEARAPRLGNRPDPHRRIRLGLLSQTLKTHPAGWLTISGFENLDPTAFEIVCLGQEATGDPIERRFRAIAASWHEAEMLNRQGLADAIRGLGIDILIELGGYGDHGMMGVCAQRVAPVQVKWVGMQSHSTGIPEMDWFVTDRWETPPELAPLYSERLMCLPDGYVVYSPPPYAPDVAALPALRTGTVTFGCFNNIAKITPDVLRCWARILGAVPDARLVMRTHQMDDPETRERIHGAFAAEGIAARRVALRGRSPHRAVLQHYAEIDIVLDPFPYVGGLTTCEALWMGVPTITMPGETFSSRHATSHLSNVGLPDWIAPDIDSYVGMAVARAADVGTLAALRAGLRGRMKASPLCDGPRFGRNLGAALRVAWQDWCARQP